MTIPIRGNENELVHAYPKMARKRGPLKAVARALDTLVRRLGAFYRDGPFTSDTAPFTTVTVNL